jgi:solute:Na+ symporter, SSS family
MESTTNTVSQSGNQVATDAATQVAASGFALADWLVLGGYFLVLALTGLILSRKKQEDTDDYFLASRSMPMWAVMLSVVATSLSAATFIGGPEISYRGNLTYLATHVGVSALLAVVIVGVFFIPAYYKHKVSTVYELLEVRFGKASRKASSVMFMVGRVFASGARLFMVAIPAAMILFDETSDLELQKKQMMIAVAVLTLVGIFYTLVGGIRSVIWTDVIQLGVFVGAAGAALYMLVDKLPIDFDTALNTLAGNTESAGGEAVENLSAPAAIEELDINAPESKLRWSDPGASIQDGSLTVQISNSFTWVASLTGLLLFNLAAYGTDQDMAQRMLTCKSDKRSRWSAIGSVLMGWPINLLFLAVGLGLFLFYKHPKLMGDAAPAYQPDSSMKVFLTFILNEMGTGMRGLLLAGLFAAGLSSLNSALNAMASTFIEDLYKPLVKRASPRHYVKTGRLAVVFWGLVLGSFAALCVAIYDAENQTLIGFALGVMVIAYSGLLAVFLTALFTKRGNNTSVIGALLVGGTIAVLLDATVWAGLSDFAKWWHGDGAEYVNTQLPERLAQMSEWCKQIALPWRMLIATAAAFAICLLGSPTSKVATDLQDPDVN